MDHSVAVGANKCEIVDVRLMSDCKSGKWLGVMTLDKSVTQVTVSDRKIEFADFADQLPMSLHHPLAFGID